jgi:vacuolar-type H+-ATPase subunit E/Vma4
MAIEDIFRALEEQADAEVNQILQAAQAQADAVEEEAREEADRIKRAKIEAAGEAVQSRVNKSINAARLQVKRDMAAAREESVDHVFEHAEELLAAMRGTADYEAVLKGLIAEATAGVEGECELSVLPADAALAEKIAAELGITCAVSPTLEGIGGVVASSAGGRIVRRNTFESRLTKVRALAGSQVAEVLSS